MSTYLIDLSPDDMRRRLGEALSVYVGAMRYPRGTEDQRASMWLEHTRRHGWKGVAAVDGAAAEVSAVQVTDHRVATVQAGAADPTPTPDLSTAPLLGVAYGYCGAPDQWWQQQVIQGLRRAGRSADDIDGLMNSYFELTELHIQPTAQGRGIGEALARRLLTGRAESNVLLSTPEITGEANRAWRLYRRLGFADVIRGYHFAGDPRPFAILGRRLPLADAPT